MEKRLTMTDLILTLLFIFMLAFAVAAFFFGVNIGNNKAAVKYEELLIRKQADTGELASYHQQYLVSFYHNTYLPYRDYQKKWFTQLNSIELSSSVDPVAVLKELRKLSEEKYNLMVTKTMPETSPLLADAHLNYLKSLKLFSEAINKFQSKAGSLQSNQIIDSIHSDAFFQEAKNFGLQAQQQYFDAILKWNESIDPALFVPNVLFNEKVSVPEWSRLNINMKNRVVSNYLFSTKIYLPFSPQDLTIRIDELIVSGQYKKLNLEDINQIAELLISTNAVRPGDFILGKDKWYGGETLPQLPFFYQSM